MFKNVSGGLKAARPGLALFLAALAPAQLAAAPTGSAPLATAPEAEVGEIQILNLTPYTLVSAYVYSDETGEATAPNGLVDRRKGQTKTAAPDTHTRIYFPRAVGKVAWVKLGFSVDGEELFARLPDVPVKSEITVAPTFIVSVNDEGGIEINQREG
ncbi:MAG: hypothetical protein NBV68_18370 [Erythrobacter sp.]|uniref:hypothetical protein n=1 Tax=Erythrobacter sp. TaxID=1042 RepID=UPI0025E11981|nr:hypothetical protein [Erythrobacter sp.]MCM0001341.1 hypothetical protein [Erythrobacter sp.]